MTTTDLAATTATTRAIVAAACTAFAALVAGRPCSWSASFPAEPMSYPWGSGSDVTGWDGSPNGLVAEIHDA
jgi:hypothetical protein